MENEQITKYTKQFKIDCILKVVSSGLALMAIVFLLFLPIFSIVDPIFGITLYSFSLFDETKNAFSLLSGGFSSPMAVMNIYQMFVLIFMALGLVMCVVTLIKNVICLTDMDKYVLEQYNNIKVGAGKKSFYNRFSATNCFISAIILEVFYIIFSKVFSSVGGGESAFESNLSMVNGVTGYIALFIIFAVGVIAITVYSKIQIRKIKFAILKEDYGLSVKNEKDDK